MVLSLLEASMVRAQEPRSLPVKSSLLLLPVTLSPFETIRLLLLLLSRLWLVEPSFKESVTAR